MKVLIDSGPLKGGHSVRGIGVNTSELIKALNVIDHGKIEIVEGDIKTENLSDYDIVHFSSFNPFFISIPRSKPKNTKFVLTIHDLIQLIYPDHYKPGLKGKSKFLINKYLIRKNIDAIITISETSKKDICRFLGVDPTKVHVIYLSSSTRPRSDPKDVEKVKEKYALPDKFVLYVGDVNYNKNIPVLVKACHVVKIPLVILVKQEKDIEKKNLDHPDLVHIKNIDWKKFKRLGFVPNEDMSSVYKAASVYVQPSLYEGFGIPVLEAFENKIPVVASKTQALVEIAQAAALFANPNDPDDFAQKIETVLKDKTLREQLVSTGSIVLKGFSWEKAATETLEVYEKI